MARRDALLALLAGVTLLFECTYLRLQPPAHTVAGVTLFFECVLVPLALALPPQRRLLLALISVALHAGIATVQPLLTLHPDPNPNPNPNPNLNPNPNPNPNPSPSQAVGATKPPPTNDFEVKAGMDLG